MGKRQGVALVVTLLGALALLVVVVAVVAGLSLSNRRVSGNKSVELEAQYAAESGAKQSRVLLQTVHQLFKQVKVDLGKGGRPQEEFAKAIYAFCHGTPKAPYTELLAIVEAIDPSSGKTYTCNASPSKLTRDLKGKTEEELGKTWLLVLTKYIPASYYAARGIRNPARFWGRVMSGTSRALSRTLRRSSDRIVTYRLSSGLAGFTPLRASVGRGQASFLFGDPKTGAVMYAVGEVRTKSGKILTTRKIQIGNEGQSFLSFNIYAPNYAWYAYFVHGQPPDWEKDPRQMVVFTSKNVIDGPVHFDDYIAFEKGSSPWFGGPVSSAGPALHPGEGVRIYWRDSAAGTSDYETPPPGTDGEHWWSFSNVRPRFAPKLDALGKPVCFNPVTKAEQACHLVDSDHDGKPDYPWVVARAVNFNHRKIGLPKHKAIETVRKEAKKDGIYLDGSLFKWVRPEVTVDLGDPPPPWIGIYTDYRGNKGAILEARGDEQYITIYADRIVGFDEEPVWDENCPEETEPPDTTPPETPPPGGGGTAYQVPSPSIAIFPVAFAQTAGDSNCAKLPPCPSECSCTCKKKYRIKTKTETITLKYTKSDRHIQVVHKDGDLAFLQLPTGEFNGIIFTDAGQVDGFTIQGPGRDGKGKPKPAIAEFAQVTVAGPVRMTIKNDVTYAKPACTKFPHRVDSNKNGKIDAGDKVVNRCTEKDFKDAAPNVFGVFARDIELYWEDSSVSPPSDITVHGVLMAYDGQIRTWYVRGAGDRGKFKLFGGMIQKQIGAIGYIDEKGNFHGYHTAAAYDRRMLHGLAPPGFLPFGEGEWSARKAESKTGTPGFWRQVPGD